MTRKEKDDRKLSEELINKISQTELPKLTIECDRDAFYNGLDHHSESPDTPEGAASYLLLEIKNIGVATAIQNAQEKGYEVIDCSVPEVPNENIPQDMQNLGVKIFRGRVLVDLTQIHEKGLTDTLKKGICYSTKNEVVVLETVFLCKKDDKTVISRVHKVAEMRIKSTLSVLFHELKHIKNGLLLLHRPYASDYKEPTEKEKYLLQVEEERTATFNSVNEILKRYLKSGNFQDFSMFSPEMDWLVKELKGKTPAQIKKLCYPPTKLMNKVLTNWNNDKLDTYFDQFQRECDRICCDSLLIPTDTTGKEFKKQRSLMYTYEVYNPYTQKDEMIDLSPAIEADIPISRKVKQKIITPCEEKRKKAKEELYALIPDQKTEILAANFSETLKREKIAQWLSKSRNSDAETILDRVRFAEPIKPTKRNFIIRHMKKKMSRLPPPERALKYAAVFGGLLIGSTFGVYLAQEHNKKENEPITHTYNLPPGMRFGPEAEQENRDFDFSITKVQNEAYLDEIAREQMFYRTTIEIETGKVTIKKETKKGTETKTIKFTRKNRRD